MNRSCASSAIPVISPHDPRNSRLWRTGAIDSSSFALAPSVRASNHDWSIWLIFKNKACTGKQIELNIRLIFMFVRLFFSQTLFTLVNYSAMLVDDWIWDLLDLLILILIEDWWWRSETLKEFFSKISMKLSIEWLIALGLVKLIVCWSNCVLIC